MLVAGVRGIDRSTPNSQALVSGQGTGELSCVMRCAREMKVRTGPRTIAKSPESVAMAARASQGVVEA